MRCRTCNRWQDFAVSGKTRVDSHRRRPHPAASCSIVSLFQPLFFLSYLCYLSKLTLLEDALSYLPPIARYRSVWRDSVDSCLRRPHSAPPCSVVSLILPFILLHTVFVLTKLTCDGGLAVVPATDGKNRQFLAGTAAIRADPDNTQQLLAGLFRCLSPRRSCHFFITYPSLL